MDRETVERCTVSFFRRGWPSLPDIRLVEVDGRRWVVKDWRPRSWLRRHLQGRPMLRREHAFLRQLEGIAGVPRSFGFPDADSLAIEHFDGRNISHVPTEAYAAAYFDRLDALVRAVHARGVVHGDLDQEDNIMVRSDGEPALIDFGGALRASRWPLLRHWYELLRRHDLQCVRRIRDKKAPAWSLHEAPDPQPLEAWQRRLLVFFRKMERREEVRVHGVGVGPVK